MPASIENSLSSPRGATTRQRLPQAGSGGDAHLTQRDQRILRLLDEHFTFTTSQLAVLAGFSSVITASHRLATLYYRDVLQRDRPFRAGGGSFEWHWMLGPVGARIVAAERGVAPIRQATIAARWQKLFHGHRYAELAAQHAWFCDLVSSAHDEHGTGAGALTVWWWPWRVSRHWRATTDGYGTWTWPDGTELPFVLLLDDPPRVGTHQIRHRLSSIPDPAGPFPVPPGYPGHTVTLVWCATLRREQALRCTITHHLGTHTGMPIALACAEYTTTPGGKHGHVWLPLGALRGAPGRVTLADVAHASAANHTTSEPSGGVSARKLICDDDRD